MSDAFLQIVYKMVKDRSTERNEYQIWNKVRLNIFPPFTTLKSNYLKQYEKQCRVYL